jgi:hypothetical protein
MGGAVNPGVHVGALLTQVLLLVVRSSEVSRARIFWLDLGAAQNQAYRGSGRDQVVSFVVGILIAVLIAAGAFI